MNRFKIAQILLGIFLILLAPNTTNAEKAIFSDVLEGHQNFTAIEFLKQEQIINGYIDGSFQPDKKVNRAEALKMIFKCFNIDTEFLPEENTFPDVPNESWFAEYILKAKELRIVNGYDDGYFRPEKTIIRAEALKMIYELREDELAEPEEDPYNDTSKDVWFAKYANATKENGILSVNLDGNIHPEDQLTRGDIAELVYRIKKSDEGFNFGKVTYYGDYFHGKSTAFGEIFDENAFTAAHKTLPYGTMIRVTNLENGKSVEVKITDRGPFTEGRILDLAKKAFEEIATVEEGYVEGQYEIIEPNELNPEKQN